MWTRFQLSLGVIMKCVISRCCWMEDLRIFASTDASAIVHASELLRTLVDDLRPLSSSLVATFRTMSGAEIIHTFHPLFASWLFLCCVVLRFISYIAHTFNYLNVKNTTLSNGYLGSRNDEERSEMRYVMRIAEFSESSNLWTQIALLGSPRSTPLSVSVQTPLSSVDAIFNALAGKWESIDLCNSLLKFNEWVLLPSQLVLRYNSLEQLLPTSDVNTDLRGLLFYVCLVWRHLYCFQRTRCVSRSCNVAFKCYNRLELHMRFESEFWSEMKRDNPLNLSILIRGGKETNKDSPSNGEWSGKSSIWKSTT